MHNKADDIMYLSEDGKLQEVSFLLVCSISSIVKTLLWGFILCSSTIFPFNQIYIEDCQDLVSCMWLTRKLKSGTRSSSRILFKYVMKMLINWVI